MELRSLALKPGLFGPVGGNRPVATLVRCQIGVSIFLNRRQGRLSDSPRFSHNAFNRRV